MDGGRENRFLAGGAEISRRGGGHSAAPCPHKSKSPASLQSARCHGILILEKHNVFEKEAVKCLF